jgi:type I restriction enzyme R subunit
VYTTNGQKIYEFDLQSGKGCFVTEYPTPEYLYVRIIGTEEVSKRHLLSQPYYLTAGLKPRYYQEIAVQNALSAIAEGAQRILLTLATGTGKTFIAFQIVYKLFQAKRSRDGYIRRPRVLFLADRNILVNQAMNTFNPLEHELVKITGKEIKKRNGKVPTNAGIFFAIYQAIVGDKGKREDIGDFMGEENYEEEAITHYFKQYPSDFFDLVIIDECHRGGANETGSRHEVLKYFSSAVHLGMTATPKRDDNIDTYNYF